MGWSMYIHKGERVAFSIRWKGFRVGGFGFLEFVVRGLRAWVLGGSSPHQLAATDMEQ